MNKLKEPSSVWMSPKTGFIYIADTKNHRIQRWKINDMKGIAIIIGTETLRNLPTMLDAPVGVVCYGWILI